MNRMAFIRMAVLPVLFSACSGTGGPGDNPGGVRPAEASDAGPAVIRFEALEHDFGTIREGEMVVCYFDYSNEGAGDLVLAGVEATCGCTTPDWSREPLPPGGSERIKVVFDSGNRSGIQSKVVTVRSNAENSPVRLRIQAIITDKE